MDDFFLSLRPNIGKKCILGTRFFKIRHSHSINIASTGTSDNIFLRWFCRSINLLIKPIGQFYTYPELLEVAHVPVSPKEFFV